MLDKDFKEIINNIQIRILNGNYEYGNKFIDEVSKDLKMEFSNSTGFSVRNLKYMKKFYFEYKDDEEVQQLVAQVPWGHNIVLMEKIKDKEIRKITYRRRFKCAY